jgi:hypothetical protein
MRPELHVNFEGFSSVLLGFHVTANITHELSKVTVNSSVTVVVGDVDRFSVAVRPHSNPRDIAVLTGVDVQTFPAFGSDVDAGVKVVRTDLAKVSAQKDRDIQRRAELYFGWWYNFSLRQNRKAQGAQKEQ